MQALKITLALVLLTQIGYAQSYYRNWKVQRNSDKERIALIIANNAYISNGRLRQPIPTAKRLEAKLDQLGFDVLVGRDLKRTQMVSVLSDFANKFGSYKFALIVYMGHGFEIDGKNYLIPIDANPPTKDEVPMHAVDMEYVLKKVNNARIPKVIILDACRNNPFKKHWTARQRATVGEGFTYLNAPINAEIFFTTQKNSMVSDHNPYINYFMDEIEKKGCVDDIVRNVSNRVRANNPKQIPAKYGQLSDKVCFGKRPNPRPKPNPYVEPDDNEVVIKGQTYKTVTIGNQTWLAENLNAYIEGSFCYDNNSSNCRKYGRLYTWKQAKAIADQIPGWHLPTDEEWDELCEALGGTKKYDRYGGYDYPNIGTKLKQGGSSGLDLLLGGSRPLAGGFGSLGNYGTFWSSTSKSSTTTNGLYYLRQVRASSSNVYRGSYFAPALFSLRLVKDG